MAEDTKKVLIELEMDASKAQKAAQAAAQVEQQSVQKRVKLLNEAESRLNQASGERAKTYFEQVNRSMTRFERSGFMAGGGWGRGRGRSELGDRGMREFGFGDRFKGGAKDISIPGSGGTGGSFDFLYKIKSLKALEGLSSLGRIGGAVAIGAKAISMGADAANAHTEAGILTSGSSNAQWRAAIQSNFLGRGAMSWWDSMTGRSHQIGRVQREHQEDAIYQQGRDQGRRNMIQAQTRQDEWNAEATALRVRYKGPRWSSFDRTDGQGELAYQEEQRRRPAREGLQQAEKNLAKGIIKEQGAQERVNKLERDMKILEQKRAGAQKDYDAVKDKGGPQALRMSQVLESYNASIERLNDDLKAAREQLKEARKNTSEARNAAEKAKAILKADLPNIQARLQQAEQNERKLGSMSRLDRMRGVQAVRMVQQLGVDNVPDEVKADAEAVAPKTMARIYENKGRETDEMAILAEIAPEDVRKGDRADTLRAQEAEALDMLRDAMQQADDDTASEIEELAKGLADIVKEHTNRAIEAALKAFQLKLQNEQLAR